MTNLFTEHTYAHWRPNASPPVATADMKCTDRNSAVMLTPWREHSINQCRHFIKAPSRRWSTRDEKWRNKPFIRTSLHAESNFKKGPVKCTHSLCFLYNRHVIAIPKQNILFIQLTYWTYSEHTAYKRTEEVSTGQEHLEANYWVGQGSLLPVAPLKKKKKGNFVPCRLFI